MKKEMILMPQLHETGYGRKFFGTDLPELIKALSKVGTELKRANDIKEMELNKNEKLDK